MISKVLIPLYLLAFISANLIVKHFGAYGLWFSSALLIPFDFVCRCVIQEKFAGARLFLVLLALTVAAAAATLIINSDALNIALASTCGFVAAQIGASIFYQSNKTKSWFFKVNISDLIAIVFDSIVFQFVAFSALNPYVTLGQICIKFAGGLLWYFILFKKLKINEKINRS